MKNSKMAIWFDEHKDEIKASTLRLCWLGLGIAFGSIVANYVSEVKTEACLYRLHDEGIIKFFDPSNGLEVSIGEAAEIAKKLQE